MSNASPAYNLYWKKYLNYGEHSVIRNYMDKNGLDVYRQVINIIETAMHLGLSGVTLIQLSRDKICFVRKTEYQDVLNYAMNFFLEKEEYLECARIRDIKENLKVRGMFDPPVRKSQKSLI
tara:strand:- start:10593 stop:10955 length:363 start_codon:yes stop_codon:yes gene_type:complete